MLNPEAQRSSGSTSSVFNQPPPQPQAPRRMMQFNYRKFQMNGGIPEAPVPQIQPTAGNYQVEDDDQVGSRNCSDCRRTGTLRQKISEGTLVCTECGFVEMSSIIDMTKEYRNFGNDSGSVAMDRTGEKLKSVDQINNLRTEVKGKNSTTNRSNFTNEKR